MPIRISQIYSIIQPKGTENIFNITIRLTAIYLPLHIHLKTKKPPPRYSMWRNEGMIGTIVLPAWVQFLTLPF